MCIAKEVHERIEIVNEFISKAVDVINDRQNVAPLRVVSQRFTLEDLQKTKNRLVAKIYCSAAMASFQMAQSNNTSEIWNFCAPNLFEITQQYIAQSASYDPDFISQTLASTLMKTIAKTAKCKAEYGLSGEKTIYVPPSGNSVSRLEATALP